jgi:hypothetical protein
MIERGKSMEYQGQILDEKTLEILLNSGLLKKEDIEQFKNKDINIKNDKNYIQPYKLNEQQAREVFALSRLGNYTNTEIGLMYGINRRTVGEIRDRKIRKQTTQNMVTNDNKLVVITFEE